jgi:phenylalanyl-tRNA synthetase alpha chain
MRANYKIDSPRVKEILKNLESRNDVDSMRIKRYLTMPDLSRTPGSPIAEIVERIINLPEFKDLDIIEVPEIVPADISFDLFDFPADHPARSKSDTYYVDKNNILRTHTTVMWYYYLQQEEVKRRMANEEPVGCFSYGKVYRKDEIDRNHMNVFHQIDGWYLAPKDKKIIGKEELDTELRNIAKAVFAPNTNIKIFDDTFPYTDPSLQMEVEKKGKWLEVLGSGVVKGSVLEKFGIDSSKWNGWAFGPGIERLAMASMSLPDMRLFWSEDPRVKKQLILGHEFKDVSKYPPIVRDISFVVKNNFVPNDYFDLVRETAPELIEQVELLDKYENAEKFGAGKISYAYRITYRSIERTLISSEIDELHKKIEKATEKAFGAQIR